MRGDQLHQSRLARTSLPIKPVDPVSTFQPCSEARIRFVVSRVFGLQDLLESISMSVLDAFLPRSRVEGAFVTIAIVAEKDPCVSGDLDVLILAIYGHVALFHFGQ